MLDVASHRNARQAEFVLKHEGYIHASLSCVFARKGVEIRVMCLSVQSAQAEMKCTVLCHVCSYPPGQMCPLAYVPTVELHQALEVSG